MQVSPAVLLLLLLKCTTADLLLGVEVPEYAFAGGVATLGCSYDLRATRLYSLKWYHNGTEFYRYVPTERNRPINIKPSYKFAVTEEYRSDRRVTLSLARLSVSASGQYRCEIIAEHPSFRTEAATAPMTVLREELAPPVLVGAREIYEPSEVIKVGCQTRRPFAHTQPVLTWLLQGEQVDERWVTPYGTEEDYTGLSLHVPGEHVAQAGGSVRAECRLSLGSHTLSAFKTLRVRRRRISYVDNYSSKGTWTKPRVLATAVLSAICLVLATL